MMACDLALPALSPAIPSVLHIEGRSGMPTALAIALLEARVITDEQLAPSNAPLHTIFCPPSETALATAALSTWWSGIRRKYPTVHFNWNLHVQELDPPCGAVPAKDGAPLAWFCLTRADGDIPRFAMERIVMLLEARLPGFGQTVLAVLYDALRLLPESLTPRAAAYWAEWIHWHDSANDEELLEMIREDHGLAAGDEMPPDIISRARFWEHMFEWVTGPRRIVSRAEIVASATDDLSRNVVAACDAIVEVVSATGYTLRGHEVGCHVAGYDPVDGCVVLLWRQHDIVGQVIDEALEMFYQGDSTEMIDTCPVPLTKKNIHKYQRRMTEMLQLAQAVERLITLIGDPI